MLNLSHQDRLCADPKPAFSFWINILTVSEAMCDCQGSGLVASSEASNLVFDTMQVLYWPVLRQIQFCSFDRRCKTCVDTKSVLYQDRFCSLTDGRQGMSTMYGWARSKLAKVVFLPLASHRSKIEQWWHSPITAHTEVTYIYTSAK